MIGQFLLDTIRSGILLIHLVDGNNQCRTRRFGMLYRFNGLRHNTIICSHHQYHNISDFGATRAHFGKRRMTRCIEESDFTTAGFDFIGTNMLRNAASFTRRDFGTTDIIQQ